MLHFYSSNYCITQSTEYIEDLKDIITSIMKEINTLRKENKEDIKEEKSKDDETTNLNNDIKW